MKKHLTILLMTIANIILLAHAFVPHHHHHEGSVVCLELSDVEKHCSEYADEALQTPSQHHHDGENNERCMLEYLFSRFDIVSKKNVFGSLFLNAPHGFSLYFQPDTNLLIDYLSVFEGVRVVHRPYCVSYHLESMLRIQPLRAPPAC